MSNKIGLTQKKSNELDMINEFQRLSLNEGKIQIPPKKPKGSSGKRMCVDTNIHYLNCQRVQVYRYDVVINAQTWSNKEVEYTKRDFKSNVAAERTKNCRQFFQVLFDQNPRVFGRDWRSIYYDLQRTLYTLNPLPIEPDQTLRLDINQENYRGRLPNGLISVQMKISNVQQVAQTFFLDDLNSIINVQTLKLNRSPMSFIEVALKQHAIFNPSDFATYHSPIIYPLHGGIPAMPDKQLDEHRTKYLAAGIQKNAVLMEGNQQNGRQLGVAIEPRYIPFHAVKPLLDYLRVHNATQSFYNDFIRGYLRMEQLNRLNSAMRGIQLTVRYPDNTTRQLDNWSFAKAVASQEIIPDKDITVEDYYNDRYGRLRHPNAHLVKVKNNYYPVELLEISDNQEVSNEQMDNRTKDVLANESSIRPDKMQIANRQASRVFGLQDSPYVQAARITVARNTIKCDARVLPPPIICGPNNSRWRLLENGESSWPIKRLLNPKPCKGFAIYVIGGNQLLVDLKDFAQNFQRTAGRLGMKLGPCQDSGTYAENQIETCIQYCADPENNIQLCIFITPENAMHCHEDIKYFERRYGVITQDLKPKTLRRLLNGDQSIYENCVLKTNTKLGGLNYALEVESREVMIELQETMIIGISSANLPEQRSGLKRNSSINDGKPNVLGFSVNAGQNFNETIGDFLYSPADNSNQHSNLRKISNICVQRFTKNRGQPPRKVLLYLYGLTPEQYKDCLKFYVPMIQLGIREVNNNVDIPLTTVSVIKKTNVRLFPQSFPPDHSKNHEFNVPHGTVVDSIIVNPIFNEFYLMSHSAPSGTAKIPRYTDVFDQNNYSMNVLEEVSHNLCYQHQIDGVSTALPTVICVAEDYAGRGRDLFNAAIRNIQNNSLPRTNDGDLDLDRLTQILNYSDSPFNNVRITA